MGIVVVGDDHPRACTGRRLIRLGLAAALTTPPARSGILLDPYATVPLCAADRGRARSGGLTAVDCSWNRLSADHARHRPRAFGPPTAGRRLPMLLAANPQHFGRVGQLNTAEALAAALHLLGAEAQSRALVGGFAGGTAFFELNGERLARYARATSPAEVARLERVLFSNP